MGKPDIPSAKGGAGVGGGNVWQNNSDFKPRSIVALTVVFVLEVPSPLKM